MALTVTDITWYDKISQQGTLNVQVEKVETDLFCFHEGLKPKLNEPIERYEFSYLDLEYESVNDLFDDVEKYEKRITQINGWDYSIVGQVLSLDADDLVVDCGILLPLSNITSDEGVIGKWVTFKIVRSELDLDG